MQSGIACKQNRQWEIKPNDNIISAFLPQRFLIKEFNLTCLNFSMSHYISACSCYCLWRYQLFCYCLFLCFVRSLIFLSCGISAKQFIIIRNPYAASSERGMRGKTTNVSNKNKLNQMESRSKAINNRWFFTIIENGNSSCAMWLTEGSACIVCSRERMEGF